jgi:hypothetical protein
MIESASAIASSGLFLSASFHLLQCSLVSEMNHDDDSIPIALEAYEKMAEQYAARVETKPHNAYVDRPTVFSLLPEIRARLCWMQVADHASTASTLLRRGLKWLPLA